MKLDMELPDETLEQIGKVMRSMALDAFKEAGRGQKFGEWLTKRDCAAYLHVAPVTLNEFIKQGLQVTTIGSVSRISKASANKFMAEHTI